MVPLTGAVVHFTHAVGGGTAVTVTGEEVTTNTPLGDCKYTFGPGVNVGTIAQGGTTLAINVVLSKTAGVLCPSTIRWNATFKVTNHNAVYYITN
jgi:hypothetical protein